MLINVTPTESQNSFYFQCSLADSTELVTKTALQLSNLIQYLERIQYQLGDLAKFGQLRSQEGRGLSETLEGENIGPDQDKEKYRDGWKPNERGQELLRQCDQEITKVTKSLTAQRQPVSIKDMMNVVDIVKGTMMIIYPQGMHKEETLKEMIDLSQDFMNGMYNEDGFYNIESATVFFANKTLTSRGETMKCLNSPESSTIKVIPSKSASYAPRSHQDQNNAEVMRYVYMREQEKKKAELMTEDDVYNRDWADPSSLKKQFHGMGDVRFK